MPDLFAAALALPGLWWLTIAIIAAGVVRGFAGFGSAMIIMPVAGSVLDPFVAITFLIVVECWGPLINFRDAWRVGQRLDALRILGGALVGVPMGLWLLSLINPSNFGWAVSLVVLFLLVILMTGWRYHGRIRSHTLVAVGGLGGLLGGFVGVPGPPVIIMYMASTKSIAVIRANFLLYLLGIDILMLIIFIFSDLLNPTAVFVGLLMTPIYIIANAIGAYFFNPNAEVVFRRLAYLVISTSAISGLLM